MSLDWNFEPEPDEDGRGGRGRPEADAAEAIALTSVGNAIHTRLDVDELGRGGEGRGEDPDDTQHRTGLAVRMGGRGLRKDQTHNQITNKPSVLTAVR